MRFVDQAHGQHAAAGSRNSG
uniref:Uncharacterized protein n=1 Tax=Arundo donax TaxID=35708 RepID=A0A0A8ZGD1_ARUDO